MTLTELRKQVEEDKNVCLAVQLGLGAAVIVDDAPAVELEIQVIHYFKTGDWKYTILYSGNDYVCAMDTFQKFVKRPLIDDGLEFTCPNCPSHRLECCEDGQYVSEIFVIDEDGDFEYGDIAAHGEVERIQCVRCGYILKDKAGENIINNEDVVEWIKEMQ